MYLYAVTFVVEPRCDADFREWLSAIVPQLAQNSSYKTYRILDERHQGHFSYSLQLEVESLTAYNSVKNELEAQNEALHSEFGEGVLLFATLLKETEL